MKKGYTYLLLFIFLYSCSVTKYVPKNELLLTKNTIIVDSITDNSEKLNEYLVQRPNFKALGLPLSLYFYNLGNPKGSEDIYQWKKHHPKLYSSVATVFSEKQAGSMANSFIGLNQWFLTNGQSPIIIDDKRTKRSEENLKTYFQNQGYFNSKVSSKKDTSATKKGTITYFISKGKPLIINNLSTDIKSPVLDSLYQASKTKTLFKTPQQYKDIRFIKESERLTKLFRNNGIFHFNKNSISFNIDTLSENHKAKIQTEIRERVIEKNGKFITKPYKIQRIKKIKIFTDFQYDKNNDFPTIEKTYNGVKFYAFDKLRYKPKRLYESIFIKPGQIYTDELRNLTRTHIRSLKNFNSTTIKYRELENDELEANILLTPTKRYSLGVETELSRSNIRIYDVSAKFSFTNKNAFRGFEIFKASGYGSIFRTEQDLGWEIGSEVSLEFPRFLAPFGLHKLVPKRMFPRSRVFGGVSIQKNIGLDRKIYNLGLDYKWKFTNKKSIHIELLNTQYIKNFNVHQYFNIYYSELLKLYNTSEKQGTPITDFNYGNLVDFMYKTAYNGNFAISNPTEYASNLNVLNRHNIITSDFLIPVISYSFTYNSQENFRDQNFSYFKIRLANSGNILGYLIPEEDNRDKKTLFDIPIAQYWKTDIEYKQFWRVSETSVIGVRAFGGVIFKYNKSDIPFSKSYFAGGSNDIRAWKTYDLGPGNRPQGLEYNVGNFKLLGNIEYRFDIVGSLKGALFIDSGNIWDITGSSYIDNPAKLDELKDITNIAVGSGFGIRYDLKFLVARLDLGFKAHEPYLENNKWFQHFNFSNTQYNIGINYPF